MSMKLNRSNSIYNNNELILLSSYSFKDLTHSNNNSYNNHNNNLNFSSSSSFSSPDNRYSNNLNNSFNLSDSNNNNNSASNIKSQYLSFKKKYLLKDHQITYNHRRLNFLRRSHYFMKDPTNKYSNYHFLSKNEQKQVFDEFLLKSKDVSLIWDEIRRLPSKTQGSSEKIVSQVNTPVGSHNVTLNKSFSMVGRRNSYLGDDASVHESKSRTKVSNETKNVHFPSTPENSSLKRNKHLSQLSIIDSTNDFDGQKLPSEIFHPMPYSNLDIVRQAQHPNRIILGGRTIINKYLNEIFQSITPNDWILPYVICILLLFNAEDKKLKDSSLLFQSSSSREAVANTSSSNSGLQHIDNSNNGKNSNNNDSNNNSINGHEFNTTFQKESNIPNQSSPIESMQTLSIKRLTRQSNSMSLIDYRSDSSQSALTFQTLNSVDEVTKSLFKTTPSYDDLQNDNILTPSPLTTTTINTMNTNNMNSYKNQNIKRLNSFKNEKVLYEEDHQKSASTVISELLIPSFPISSYFPSYRYLSTVYLTNSSSGMYQPIFWIKKHLFVIDSFIFQCDLDDDYLIPTGFLYLDEDSVKLIERSIVIRETSSTKKIVTDTYIQIQISKSPYCNPLESLSSNGLTTIFFVSEKGLKIETENLYNILVEASRLSVYDVYECDKKNKLGTGRYADIFDCPSRFSILKSELESESISMSKISDISTEDSASRGSKSYSSDKNSNIDQNNHNSRIAVKLIKKENFSFCVNNHEERPCTLLREIVLLWRANYKVIYNDDKKIESNLSERPFMKIFGIMETKDYIVIEMERMEKLTLFNVASDLGQFSEKQTRHIAIQLVQSIYHLNLYDIAHRDIKLSNICFPYLDRNSNDNSFAKYLKLKNKLFKKNQLKKIKFNIKLIDFGMSGYIQEDGMLRGRCGTIGCVAPEILNSSSQEGYCLACDMFSIGVVLYTLYTGYEPFYGNTNEELTLSNKIGYVDTTTSDWTSLSLDGQDFILSCLNTEASKRLTPFEALNHKWIVSYYGHDCYNEYPPISIKKKKSNNIKYRRGITCNIS